MLYSVCAILLLSPFDILYVFYQHTEKDQRQLTMISIIPYFNVISIGSESQCFQTEILLTRITNICCLYSNMIIIDHQVSSVF